MKVTILDDYFDTLRTLPCFRKLDGHDVTIWNDHVQDADALADAAEGHRGAGAHPRAHQDPRAPARAPAALRLISQRSVYPHIDVDGVHAARRRSSRRASMPRRRPTPPPS